MLKELREIRRTLNLYQEIARCASFRRQPDWDIEFSEAYIDGEKSIATLNRLIADE